LYAFWYFVNVQLEHVAGWAKSNSCNEPALNFLRETAPWFLVACILLHQSHEV